MLLVIHAFPTNIQFTWTDINNTCTLILVNCIYCVLQAAQLPDLLATSGDYLRLWRLNDSDVRQECMLNNVSIHVQYTCTCTCNIQYSIHVHVIVTLYSTVYSIYSAVYMYM